MKNFSMIVFILLVFTNIYSQGKMYYELQESNINSPFLSNEKWENANSIKSKRLEKEFNKIVYFQNYDLTSVIDSVVIKRKNGEVEKYTYINDSNGNIDSYIREKWYGGSWERLYKFTYTNNSSGNKILELEEKWDKNQWVNYHRRTYTYDSNGDMLSHLYEIWFETENGWVNSEQYTYTYDSSGNKTLYLNEKWEGNIWVNYQQEVYGYDLGGKITSYLYQNWKNNQWENSFRYSYTYSDNGDIKSELSEVWSGSQWHLYILETNSYDLKNNKIKGTYEFFDGSQWVLIRKSTYTYETNGNVKTTLTENTSGTQLVNYKRESYNYDSNGNMILCFSENWDETQWVNDVRETYTFDSNNMTTYLSEIWSGSLWILLDRDIEFYDSFSNYFEFYCSELSLYYSPITNIEKAPFNNFDYSLSQNYPNPFNPSTTIRYSIPVVDGHAHQLRIVTIKVYDILGREVTTLVNKGQKPGNYEIKFDASRLTSGIYYYRITADDPASSAGQGFVKTMKMILIK